MNEINIQILICGFKDPVQLKDPKVPVPDSDTQYGTVMLVTADDSGERRREISINIFVNIWRNIIEHLLQHLATKNKYKKYPVNI